MRRSPPGLGFFGPARMLSDAVEGTLRVVQSCMRYLHLSMVR